MTPDEMRSTLVAAAATTVLTAAVAAIAGFILAGPAPAAAPVSPAGPAASHWVPDARTERAIAALHRQHAQERARAQALSAIGGPGGWQ